MAANSFDLRPDFIMNFAEMNFVQFKGISLYNSIRCDSYSYFWDFSLEETIVCLGPSGIATKNKINK